MNESVYIYIYIYIYIFTYHWLSWWKYGVIFIIYFLQDHTILRYSALLPHVYKQSQAFPKPIKFISHLVLSSEFVARMINICCTGPPLLKSASCCRKVTSIVAFNHPRMIPDTVIYMLDLLLVNQRNPSIQSLLSIAAERAAILEEQYFLSAVQQDSSLDFYTSIHYSTFVLALKVCSFVVVVFFLGGFVFINNWSTCIPPRFSSSFCRYSSIELYNSNPEFIDFFFHVFLFVPHCIARLLSSRLNCICVIFSLVCQRLRDFVWLYVRRRLPFDC